MKLKLTLLIKETESGFVGQIKELPSVLTQGDTRKELMENIEDALWLVLDYMRDEFKTDFDWTEEEIIFTT